MPPALTQLAITEISAAYWRVTFDNPPLNLIGPETILELQYLLGLIESREDLRVIVFESAHRDFYFARYDFARAGETPVALGPTGFPYGLISFSVLRERRWSALHRFEVGLAAPAASSRSPST